MVGLEDPASDSIMLMADALGTAVSQQISNQGATGLKLHNVSSAR